MLDGVFYSAIAGGGVAPTPVIMEIRRNKILIVEIPVYIS